MDRESKLFGENIEHPADVISKYDIIPDQLDMRIDLVLKVFMEHDLKPENMDAAIGRGGCFYISDVKGHCGHVIRYVYGR